MLIRCPGCWKAVSNRKDNCPYCKQSILSIKKRLAKKEKYSVPGKFFVTRLSSSR